jgi:predicted nucleotidyltransferase component of viral defense system
VAYRGPGKGYFGQVAARTGFRVVELEKAYRLVEILARFQENPLLQHSLALKGGTALNFLHSDFRRLSVDLDFNFVGDAARDETLRTRPMVAAAAANLFSVLGYTVGEPRGGYALSSYDLGYEAVTGGNEKLKVEINFLERVPVLELVRKRISHPFELPKPPVQTYQLAELVAGKVRALIQRKGAKDIFDIATASENMGERISPPARQLAVFYCALDQVDLRRADLDLMVEPKEIRNVMLSYVKGRGGFDPSDLLSRARRFIDPLRILDEKEAVFLHRFLDELSFDPEELLEGFNHNPDVFRHPSAMWILQTRKAKNG